MDLVTIKEASLRLGINYGTLRTWSSKYQDFPKPEAGRLRDFPEVKAWYEEHIATRRHGGSQWQQDASARAQLGHKFRRVRNLNKCADCARSFQFDEEIWELRNGDDLEILCSPCYSDWLVKADAGSHSNLHL